MTLKKTIHFIGKQEAVHSSLYSYLNNNIMEKVSKLAAKSKGIVEKCILIIMFHTNTKQGQSREMPK